MYLNSIQEFEFNSTKFNLTNGLKFNYKKFDANYQKTYSKSSCEYGIGKKNLKMTQI